MRHLATRESKLVTARTLLFLNLAAFLIDLRQTLRGNDLRASQEPCSLCATLHDVQQLAFSESNVFGLCSEERPSLRALHGATEAVAGAEAPWCSKAALMHSRRMQN